MTPEGKSSLERMTGAAYFDRFEPLRKMMAMKEQSDRVLGLDVVKKLNSIASGSAPEAARSLGPIVDQKILTTFQQSTLEQLALGGIRKPLVEEAIQSLTAGGTLSQAIEKADLYGALRLDDTLAGIRGLRESVLIGSAVMTSGQLQDLGLAASAQPALDQLMGSLRFEPGQMLTQIGGLDTKALMLGRQATLAAVQVPDINWSLDRDVLTVSDLVAPVEIAEDDLVTAAFPPDLIEEDPLSSEFEVDAIVAEYQTGAQVYLALRSPKAAQRMASARERLAEGDTEALAHSLTSCRRALHALADTVYPARRGKVKDRTGTEREVHAEAFKNRLLMFLTDAITSSRMRELAEAQIEKVTNHLDALVTQLDKGVHADVVRDEVTQAYVETWAFIAHVARVVSDD